MIKSRRGEELVEAAMVLPLLILIVLSLVLLMMFYLDCHQTQIKTHEDLLQSFDRMRCVFDQECVETSVSEFIGGMAGMMIGESRQHKVYLIHPAKILMIGELGLDET